MCVLRSCVAVIRLDFCAGDRPDVLGLGLDVGLLQTLDKSWGQNKMDEQRLISNNFKNIQCFPHSLIQFWLYADKKCLRFYSIFLAHQYSKHFNTTSHSPMQGHVHSHTLMTELLCMTLLTRDNFKVQYLAQGHMWPEETKVKMFKTYITHVALSLYFKENLILKVTCSCLAFIRSIEYRIQQWIPI